MMFRESTKAGSSRGDTNLPGEPRSGGERSEPERSGSPGEAGSGPPDPEVPEKPVRRRFKAEYKLRILKEADACKGKLGKIGELLRREGLYSSHVTTWRLQHKEGALRGLSSKKRGRKAKKADPLARRVAQLERENGRLRDKLKQAETIIEIQKKVSALLGISPDSPESSERF